MPDPVLEFQTTIIPTGPGAQQSVLCRNEYLTSRSAVFVDLYASLRYGTRLIISYVHFFADNCSIHRSRPVCLSFRVIVVGKRVSNSAVKLKADLHYMYSLFH